MNGRRRPRTQSSGLRLLGRAFALAAFIVSSVAVLSPSAASATSLGYKVDLNVLVLDDGSNWVGAIKSQMDVEGVKYTSVAIASASITNSFLTNNSVLASATEAKFQAVVVPDHTLTGLTGQEPAILHSYEAKFGVRQVNAFENNVNNFSEIGLGASTFDNDLNGATANVTAAGKANGFGYLNGPVPFVAGSFTHIATPLVAPTPAGATFMTMVESAPPGGGSTGTIMGVYASGGVEQMVITAAFADTFLQFKYLGHGIITWMTRGVHFGYDRNNFTFHFDDAFGTDALWDPTLNCTPGEDCLIGTDPPGARMTAADVTYAVSWMLANSYQITLPFNASYAAQDDGADAGTAPDPGTLSAALVDNKAAFRWLNHGFEHIYQGCVQNFGVTPWVCTTSGGVTTWVSQTAISNEILNNITAGNALGLSFDTHEYLSGEHSGLQYSSGVAGQTQTDNPNFAPALTQRGITSIGTDASRETGSRVVGTATSIPRHPTALYYNTATRTQAVDEYNWFYTTAVAGGSGTCGTDAAVPPCIVPLTTDADFDNYIVPTDTAFDLGFILSNDPRPFYAHVTNLVGGAQALAYPLLNSILGTYRTIFTSDTPVMNLTLTQAATELARQQQWAADKATVTGYVQNGVVSITNSTGHVVPFTAPTGTTVAGNTLAAYGGEVSAWLAAGSPTGTLPAPALTTTGGTFLVGQSSAMTFSVASTPDATVSITSNPVLPAGLTYTSTPGGLYDATITGTAPAGSEKVYTLTVTVTSAGYNNTETVLLTVPKTTAFTSATSATATSGSPFTFNVTTTGVPNAAITFTGTLPAGLALTDLGTGTATISGTPAASSVGRSYPITLTATNALLGAVTQSFTLTVNGAPYFSSATSATAEVGSPFAFTVTAPAGPTAAITTTGALPSGITFTDLHNGTATLSGTAAPTTAGHTYPLTFTATNSHGAVPQSFTLKVEKASPLVSMAPARLADTRPGFLTVDGLFAGGGTRPAGSTLELVVGGRANVPTDASAVALNVTVTSPTGSGYVTVYPCGADQPTASNLNFTPGDTVPNAVIARMGAGGKVCIYVSAATQLIVDVNGYFPATSSFTAMNPARIVDTRPGFTTVDALQQGGGPRSAGTFMAVDVTGRASVPDDAVAVVLNVTVTGTQGSGHVTVYPCGAAMPNASNLNYPANATVANLVIAKVGADGNVCIFNYAATDLVVDITGYFPAGASYLAADPARLLDTRPSGTTVDGLSAGGGLVPAQHVTELTVAGRGPVPAGASTVVLNVTVTEATGAGYVTVYPCGIEPPTASNLNYEIGTTRAIAVVVQVGTGGKVCLYNWGATQMIVDVNGYLSA